MAAITFTEIQALRDLAMFRAVRTLGVTGAARRITVLVAIPTATSDATAGVFLVHDPDPGDTANTTATQQSNAKGGTLAWKAYSYANLVTAYSLS